MSAVADPFVVFGILFAVVASQLLLKLLDSLSQIFSVQEEETILRQDIANKTKKAAQLNSPSTFAEHAKVMRDIEKNKKALKLLVDKRQNSRVLFISTTVARATKFLLPVSLVYFFWSTPIIQFSDDVLFPLGWLFARPTGAVNTVGVISWYTICSSIAARLITAVAPK